MSKSSSVLAPDPRSLWPSKAAAAAQLGCSVRTLERYIDAGRLRSREQHASGRKPVVVVDPESIAAVLEESRAPAVRSGAVSSAGVDVPELFQQLLGAVAAGPRSAVPRPWLTIDEAAEYSGLPRGWLLAQARAGSAIALDVGGGVRRSWRFSRDRLAKVSRV